MTDDEQDAARIAIIEKWLAATNQCIPVFALRWLLADWRRLSQLDAEHADATDCLMRDAARWRYCEREAEASDGGWWVLTEKGPTFAEAVDAAIAREKADGKAQTEVTKD